MHTWGHIESSQCHRCMPVWWYSCIIQQQIAREIEIEILRNWNCIICCKPHVSTKRWMLHAQQCNRQCRLASHLPTSQSFNQSSDKHEVTSKRKTQRCVCMCMQNISCRYSFIFDIYDKILFSLSWRWVWQFSYYQLVKRLIDSWQFVAEFIKLQRKKVCKWNWY